MDVMQMPLEQDKMPREKLQVPLDRMRTVPAGLTLVGITEINREFVAIVSLDRNVKYLEFRK